ncbi:MAG: alanyl-tRNA editing protein [Spirochaetaceae bacterium]|jgi:alanyl-tRNA synthetase|nr:alanyl-tRNA editing protein [Spirochaetaceae bacterium]
MRTAALYYDYDSAAPFSAGIVERRLLGEQAALILDRTIFYPEGGGQAADRGTINGAPLLDVQEREGEILHLADAGADLRPGPAVLVLDAARRRDFTVQHTAQHLLSGTLLSLAGAHTVSMHLGDEVSTIDVEAPDLDAETLAAAEDAVIAAIEADAPVLIHLCPPEDAGAFPLRKKPPAGEEVIRVVEIAGSDFSPCCGTHLKSTGGIGMLRILGAEKYKGMTRVSFIAGRRVLRDSRMLRHNGEAISRALKAPLAETARAVSALLEKTARLERQVGALSEKAARIRAEALLAETGLAEAGLSGRPGGGRGRLLVRVFREEGLAEILDLGRAAQKLTQAALVFASEPEGKFAAFCAAKDADLRLLLREKFEALGGRGGGGPGFFQGVFDSPERLTLFMESLADSTEAL